MKDKKKYSKPICIIPARGGSKRLPKKNIALLNNKPLLCYTIESALESNIFEKIYVSSEDSEILKIASNYSEIEAIPRPLYFAQDNIQIKEFLLYFIPYLQNNGSYFDTFFLLLPTSPLRKACDIKNAYKHFKNENSSFLMSVIPFSHPPQRAVYIKNGNLQPYFGIEYMKNTQNLEKLYRHDGSVFIAKTKAFLKEKELYGSKVTPFFSEEERSVDIDNYQDLKWTKFLMHNIK